MPPLFKMDAKLLNLLLLIFAILQVVAVVGLYLYIRSKYRAIKEYLGQVGQLAWTAPNLVAALQPSIPLPQPDEWAASGGFLAELIGVITRRKPALVVELGSGFSTLVIAATLVRLGTGKLCSIDHDAGYAARTRDLLNAHGLADITEVRLAPLMSTEVFDTSQLWYDVSQMTDLKSVDLLVVDGPPADFDPTIRYPALPFFWSRLSPEGIVMLDDAERDAERLIVQRWQLEFPDVKVKWIKTRRGFVLLTREGQL